MLALGAFKHGIENFGCTLSCAARSCAVQVRQRGITCPVFSCRLNGRFPIRALSVRMLLFSLPFVSSELNNFGVCAGQK